MHLFSGGFAESLKSFVSRPLFIACIVAVVLVVVIQKIRILTVVSPLPEPWLAKYRYAHRGLHGNGVPENSLASFEAAARAGYAIELDVRLTRDGCPVVFHDRWLSRMTGHPGRLRDYSLAQLRTMRLAGTDQRIPTIAEVIQLVDGRVPILFELVKKGFSGKLERRFYDVVKDYHGKYAVQSFSPFCIRWFKKNAPAVPRGQLACDFRFCFEKEIGRFGRFFLDKILFVFKRLETNFISRPNFISYEYHKVNSKLLQYLRKKGALIFAWTIQSKEEYDYASGYTDAVIFENFTPAPLEAVSE